MGEVSYDDWPNLEKENPFSDDKDIVDNQVVILEYEGGVRATFHSKKIKKKLFKINFKMILKFFSFFIYSF